MPTEQRVALCVACFYGGLAEKLEAGARAALDDAGVADVDRFEVPGAFELPLVASYAATQAHFLECLSTGRRFATDGEDTLRTMRAVFAAYESADRGEPVNLVLGEPGA